MTIKERPILFSAPMIRALLDGTKTQTRRAVKRQFANDAEPAEMGKTNEHGHQLSGHSGMWWDDCEGNPETAARCPYGQSGDRLVVREAWRTIVEADALPPRDLSPSHRIWYEADQPHQPGFGRYRPGMFMPQWASRITLEVTEVRVERLQDISEADAIAEGCIVESVVSGYDGSTIQVPAEIPDPSGVGMRGWDDAREWYADLWESINGPGSWDVNPWVWVVSFKRVEEAA